MIIINKYVDPMDDGDIVRYVLKMHSNEPTCIPEDSLNNSKLELYDHKSGINGKKNEVKRSL